MGPAVLRGRTTGAGTRCGDHGPGRWPRSHPSACGASPNVTYVGLDISQTELGAAGQDAYDETVVADILKRRRELEGRFDLILSWQVLEHVDSMEQALENIRAYMRPGGRFVALLSGSRSIQALLARAIPYPVANRLMKRLMGSQEGEKFPTRYDGCTAKALEPLLARWSEHGTVPRYKAGAYVRFFGPLERVYIEYENWVERTGRVKLATHYVIWAVR